MIINPNKNPIHELLELAIYLQAASEVIENEKLAERLVRSSEWLEKLSSHICVQGYIGCTGGHNCTSDHK